MTYYAGETVVWTTSATGVDSAATPITSADVTSVLITIVDTATDTALLADAAMTWDVTDVEWRYIWTTPVTAGKFIAKMRIVSTTFDIWELQKLSTKALPAGF